MGFSDNQIELIDSIRGFFTNERIKFINWNYCKIGPTGGGNIEGWLERELDYYLEKNGYKTRPKKQREADLMFEVEEEIDWEKSIEIRTGSHPSSSWIINKITLNNSRGIHPLYMYLYVPSPRTLDTIRKKTKQLGLAVKEYPLAEKLMLIFIH